MWMRMTALGQPTSPRVAGMLLLLLLVCCQSWRCLLHLRGDVSAECERHQLLQHRPAVVVVVVAAVVVVVAAVVVVVVVASVALTTAAAAATARAAARRRRLLLLHLPSWLAWEEEELPVRASAS